MFTASSDEQYKWMDESIKYVLHSIENFDGAVILNISTTVKTIIDQSLTSRFKFVLE